MHDVLLAWHEFLRKGSRTSFFMPYADRNGMATVEYAWWYRSGVDAYLNISFDLLVAQTSNEHSEKSTENARSSRSAEFVARDHIPESAKSNKLKTPSGPIYGLNQGKTF
jgi:hypothetical protein